MRTKLEVLYSDKLFDEIGQHNKAFMISLVSNGRRIVVINDTSPTWRAEKAAILEWAERQPASFIGGYPE